MLAALPSRGISRVGHFCITRRVPCPLDQLETGQLPESQAPSGETLPPQGRGPRQAPQQTSRAGDP